MSSKKDSLLGALKARYAHGNGQLRHDQLIAILRAIGMRCSDRQIKMLAEQLPDPVPIGTFTDWLYSGVDQLSTAGQTDTLAPNTCSDAQITIELCNQVMAMPLSSTDYQNSAGRLERLINMRSICFIKGSWLLERASLGKPIPRRQDIPTAALWKPHELLTRWRCSRHMGSRACETNPELCLGALGLCFIAISYSWCNVDHPDPDCFHLRRLAKVLDGFQKLSQIERGWDDFAIFWDYMSLFQKPRNTEEDSLFRLALHNMQVVYGHQLVWVWKMRAMPPCPYPLDDETGKFQLSDGRWMSYTYESRGWPTFESTTADSSREIAFSRLAFDADVSMLDLSLTEVFLKFGCTGVAVHPDQFEAILRNTTFTNGSDMDSVLALYCQTFEELKKATDQNLQGITWTEETLQTYFQAFGEMDNLRRFNLYDSPGLGINGVRRFLQQLASKPRFQKFYITHSGLDDTDIKVLFEEFPMFRMTTAMYNGHLRLIGERFFHFGGMSFMKGDGLNDVGGYFLS